jgi:hypothetical protein
MRHTSLLIWAYLFLISISHAHASSVRQITMNEMLQQCQFVFEGTVVALEARENSQNRIHTYVTFEIQDIIKGSYSDNTITLSFLGGTIGNVTMAVGDMVFPKTGEHGIYFVESLERSQVHPLYGWSQGHFLVRPDDTGRERVMTNGEQPVTEVLTDISIEQKNASQKPVTLLSKGVVDGITLGIAGNDNTGLPVEEFKNILREKMGMGQ